MSSRRDDDELIDELLRWLAFQLRIPRRGVGSRRPNCSLSNLKQQRPPASSTSPAKHNAPLDKIERASDRLSRPSSSCDSPVRSCKLLEVHSLRTGLQQRVRAAWCHGTLTNIRDAARKARVSRTGRPRNFLKQHIVDLGTGILRKIFTQAAHRRREQFLPALC